MEIGNLFIVSAPSGTGKTTILKRIISEMENIMFSVSHTTRPPRPGEKDGVDYYFVEKDAFKNMQEQELFHEWAEVHGNLYGTSRNAVQKIIDQGKDIILDIDVQGGLQAMDKVGDKGIFIFILLIVALFAIWFFVLRKGKSSGVPPGNVAPTAVVPGQAPINPSMAQPQVAPVNTQAPVGNYINNLNLPRRPPQ